MIEDFALLIAEHKVAFLDGWSGEIPGAPSVSRYLGRRRLIDLFDFPVLDSLDLLLVINYAEKTVFFTLLQKCFRQEWNSASVKLPIRPSGDDAATVSCGQRDSRRTQKLYVPERIVTMEINNLCTRRLNPD
jgi:hypothetical protein